MSSVNLDSLTWIKTELERSLDASRQRLDAFAEEPENRALLREVAEYLHQVAGTLTMVEVRGGQMLAEHLEALTRVVYEGRLSPERSHLEPLMRGCLELSDYLDRMVSGMRDSPAVLLPVTNEIRNLLGREPLARERRHHPTPPTPHGAAPGENLAGLATRLRPRYQAALLAFYQGTGGNEPVARMRAVVAELELAASNPPVFEFLWVASGVLEALDEGGLDSTLGIKRLLGQVERELKRLATSSEAALAEEPPEALVEELLTELERASSNGERVSAIRANFEMDAPEGEAKRGVGGPGSALLRSVSTAILEDLSRVHDRIDIFVRTGRQQPRELEPVATTLKKAGDALGLMGLSESRDRVKQQSNIVAQMAASGSVEEPALLQLATELIGIEGEVEAFLHGAGMDPQAAAQHSARMATLREVLAEISRIKNVIGEHMRSGDESESLGDLPRLADNLARTLDFMNLLEVAPLVHRMARYLERMAANDRLPERIELDRLADAVVSIEYYVEALQRDHGNADSMLDNAARALSVLGVDEIQGVTARHAPELETAGEAESEEQPESRTEPEPMAEPEMVARQHVELPPVREEGADPEIVDIFIEEAEEVAEVLNENYPRWSDNTEDSEALITVRRAFHTLKGSGRMVGAKRLGEFAWAFENLLNRVMDHTLPASEKLVATIGESIAAVSELMIQFRDGTEPKSDIAALMYQAQRMAHGEGLGAEGGEEEPETPEAATVGTPAEAESGDNREEAVEEEEAVAFETDDETGVVEALEGAKAAPEEERTVVPRIDPALYEIYRNEAQAHLASVREWLDDVAAGREQGVNFDLVRAIHTLLGSARMAEVTEVAALLAPLERLIKHAEAEQSPANTLNTEIEAAAVTTQALVKAYASSEAMMPEWQSLRDHFEALLAEQEAARESTEPDAAGAPEEHVETEAEAEAEAEQEASAESNQGDVSSAGEPMEEVAPDETDIEEPRSVVRPVQSVTVIELDSLEGYDANLAEVYLSEATELLETADAAVHSWAQDHDQTEPLTEMLRLLHTLKGGARMVGITPLADMSHELESLLVRVADGRVAVSGDLLRLIERAFDRLHRMLEHAGGDGRVPYDTAVVMELQRHTGGGEIYDEEDGEPEEEEAMPFAPAPGIGQTTEEAEEAEAKAEQAEESEETPKVTPRLRHEMTRVRADLLETSINNAGEMSIYRSRVEQQLIDMNQNLTELDRTVERVHTQLRELDIETEAQILSEHRAELVAEGFDPLEFDRYTRLHELSRSLAEAVSDLSSLRSLLASELQQANVLLERQGRVNGDLQDALMRTRMVPFSLSAGRLRRIVRNTSEEVGKRAVLKMSGVEGEMDRQVLEHILPALEHLLRNAVVHGIEEPAVRKSRGKPEDGQIELRLRREGADVMIEVIDDGGGLDLKAIRSKAEQEEIIPPGAELSERETIELVFRPGFTTATSLTQAAGRGVGMDVVAAEARQVGGSVEVETKPFEGACWRLRLPVTLAITQTLLIRIGRTLYPVPLASLSAIQRVPRAELESIMEAEEPVYEYGGSSYHLMSLAQVLGEETLGVDEESPRVPLLLVNVGDRCVAMVADDMEGNREVVVKPVGPQIAHVPGISGATIFGDGSIGLLLDLSALVRSLPQVETMEALPEIMERTAIAEVAPLVMVVDDSITVRRVTQRLLERRGARVLTAKDGIEALEQLQDHKPDVMLLDIEMPRMDGYELAGHMKNDSRLRSIPIIVITSRTGEKHRARADQIGIERYLGKPYQEVELLEAIQAMVVGFDPLGTRTISAGASDEMETGD